MATRKVKTGVSEVASPAMRRNQLYPGEGIYTGQVFNHKRHGVGVMKEANGTVLYEGEWKDDKPSGYGKKYFPRTGDRHEGSYKSGERQGLGVYLWANGNRYSGDWSLGLMHGRGRFEWVGTGEVYNGEWVQGKMTGEGIKVLGDTSRMSGTFHDGALHGWAEKTFAGGDRYRGNFEHNRRCGYGEYVWADGRSYRGTWEDELMHGAGELVAAVDNSSHVHVHDRSSGIDSVVHYRGEVCRGSLQGHGTARMFDGSLYTGDWRDDRWEGWGRVEYPDGSVYEGDVQQGHRAGLGQLTCHLQGTDSDVVEMTPGVISAPITAALAPPAPPLPAFAPPEEELDFAAQGTQVSVEAILNTWGGVYIGAWRADVPHGQGTLQLWNGQMFQGMFMNGKIVEPENGTAQAQET